MISLYVLSYIEDLWQGVGGTGLVAANIGLSVFSINDSGVPYVAYYDKAQRQILVKCFNDGSWEQVGNPITPPIGYLDDIQLAFLNDEPAMYYNDHKEEISVQYYSGGTWNMLSNGPPTDSSRYKNIEAKLKSYGDDLYLAFFGFANSISNDYDVYKYTAGNPLSWTSLNFPKKNEVVTGPDELDFHVDTDGNLYLMNDWSIQDDELVEKFIMQFWAYDGVVWNLIPNFGDSASYYSSGDFSFMEFNNKLYLYCYLDKKDTYTYTYTIWVKEADGWKSFYSLDSHIGGLDIKNLNIVVDTNGKDIVFGIGGDDEITGLTSINAYGFML